MRLLTELMQPAQYGEMALAITAATLINQIVFGPLGNGITRFYAPAVEQGDLAGYLNGARRLVGRAALAIVLAVPVVMIVLLLAHRARWLGITAAAFLLALLSGCNAVLNGLQSAARQRAVVALHQGLDTWGRFLFAAALLVIVAPTSLVAVLGQALAVLLVIVSQYRFFRRIVPRTEQPATGRAEWFGEIWRYSWPFALWGLFYWAQSASDRWALALFASTTQVGLYAVLYQLGYYPISIATGMAVQLLAPIFYQRAGDATDSARNASVHKLSWNLTWITLGVTSLAFVLALLLHHRIFSLLVAANFNSMSYLLPWMLLSGGLFAAGQTIALNLMSQMKTHAMMVAKVATSAVGVLFNFAGAYYLGVRGIVIASVAFSVVNLISMILLSKPPALPATPAIS